MQRPREIDRRILFWVARHWYAARVAEPPGPEGPDRVLLVRVDERVGNLVTLQSLLDALRAKIPRASLGLVVSSRLLPVAKALQGLDRLHGLDKRWFFRRPRAWRRAIAEVRRVAYQVAIDVSAWHEFSFTHAVLTYYSGAPVRVGYDRDGWRGLHSHLVPPGPEDEHELKQRMRLLGPLGIRAEPPLLRSSMGKEQQQRWARWLGSCQLARPRIGIWAGSRKLERRWPMDFFIRLGRKLQLESCASLVVLWGPGEEKVRNRLAQALPGGLVVTPATDLSELAGILRCLDLAVTNDTGPMHLSVAVGTPTVSLFASGDPARWGHPYPHVRNLYTPGRDPAEVDQAHSACRQLLQDFAK